jgi:hypothetical protein
MFHTDQNGASCVNPANNSIRADGEGAGWPTSPEVEAEVAAWFDAKTLDEEKAIVRRLNKAALDHVVYAPLGFFLLHQAWADSNLYPDDHIAIGVGDLDGLGRRHQTQFLAFPDHYGSRERENAGKRDVQVGEDAHRARLDDMLATARKVSGTSAPGVDASRNAAGSAKLLSINSE